MSCPSCLTGGTSTSSPKGTTSTIHGLPTYIASPPPGTSPKGLIVLITDAFGWDFVNNRVLADHYAERGGYLVYVPDFMNGKAMSPAAITLMDNLTTPAPTWLSAIIHKPLCAIQLLRLAIPWKSACEPAKTHPGVISFLHSLRTSTPPFPAGPHGLKIGVAAFCWGGKHAFMLAQPSPGSNQNPDQNQNSDIKENLINCIFTAHPSYIAIPSEVQNIHIPTSVIVGSSDAVLKHPQALEMQQILAAKRDCEMVILEGAKHGFAIRTHPDDEREMEMAMRAEEQALAWFERWLGSGPVVGTSVPGAGAEVSGMEG